MLCTVIWYMQLNSAEYCSGDIVLAIVVVSAASTAFTSSSKTTLLFRILPQSIRGGCGRGCYFVHCDRSESRRLWRCHRLSSDDLSKIRALVTSSAVVVITKISSLHIRGYLLLICFGSTPACQSSGWGSDFYNVWGRMRPGCRVGRLESVK